MCFLSLQYLDIASSLSQFGYRQLDDVEFDHPKEGMKGIQNNIYYLPWQTLTSRQGVLHKKAFHSRSILALYIAIASFWKIIIV